MEGPPSFLKDSPAWEKTAPENGITGRELDTPPSHDWPSSSQASSLGCVCFKVDFLTTKEKPYIISKNALES